MEIFENAKNNRSINEINFPILTKEGGELSVSWNTLTIGDGDEVIFIGMPASKMRIAPSKRKKVSKKYSNVTFKRECSNTNESSGGSQSLVASGVRKEKETKVKTLIDSESSDNSPSVSNEINIGVNNKKRRRQIRELKKTIRTLNRKILQLEKYTDIQTQ